MIIEFGAFKNCSSLEELNFSKNTEIVSTNITQTDNVFNCKIIVPDSLYKDWMQAENLHSVFFITRTSDFIMSKLSNKKFGKIAASIIYMLKAIQFLDNEVKLQLLILCENLQKCLNIDELLLKEVELLLNMKENNKDGQSLL